MTRKRRTVRRQALLATLSRWRSLGLAAAPALALAACANGDVIYDVEIASYSPGDVGYAASLGPIPVRTLGRPGPDASPESAADEIAAAFTRSAFNRAAKFEAKATPDPEAYVVVVRFGASAGAADICRPGAVGGASTEYGAAFCKDGKALSYLSGRAPTADAQAPAFGNAMATAGAILMPVENPNRRDCDRTVCN